MRVGIVTPAYNVAPWIDHALRSVLAQTYADWATVIVDDGSTDNTVDRVTQYSDPRFRLIRQDNAGVAAARNRGIAAIEADAVVFLDADDFLAPDALSRLVAALIAAPEAVAACAGFGFVDEDAAPGAPAHAVRAQPLPSGGALPLLLERNLFANGGHLLIRRNAMTQAGDFRAGIAYGEDWEYWIRLALLGQFVSAPGSTPALFVRQRASGAYLRMAADPSAFDACMDAIFGNPSLRARFPGPQLDAIRRRAESENQWIIGRELVRHGRAKEGRRWLRRSASAKPSVRRAALLLAAHTLALLPPQARGPFRPYPSAVR